MLSAKFILAAFSTFIAVSAAPGAGAAGALGPPTEQPTLTVCSDSITAPDSCVTIPVVSSSCVNLIGGFTFFNKEISEASVPARFVCKFFEDFGCLNGGVIGHDVAVLAEGTWSFFNVRGIAGTQSFNDLTSSISCLPVQLSSAEWC